MRAEERHELRENNLSNWLQYGAWAFIKQNGSYILLIAALCFLGYRIYEYYQQKHAFEELAAYQDLDTAIRNENDRISNMPFDTSLSAAALESAAKADADAGMLPQAAAKYAAALDKYRSKYDTAPANSPERISTEADMNRMLGPIVEVLEKESDRILQNLQVIVDTATVKEVRARAALELGRLYSLPEAANPAQWAGFALASRPLSSLYIADSVRYALDDANLPSSPSRPENLSKSYQAYSKALQLWGDDPLIAAKAHLGIAAVYEDQGEWDKARAEYQVVIDGPQFAGASAELAKERQSSMEDRKNAPRLAAWTPPKPVAPAPTPGTGGVSLPSVNLNLPETGLISPTTPPLPFMIGPTLGPPSNLGGGMPPASAPALPTLPILPLTPETQPK